MLRLAMTKDAYSFVKNLQSKQFKQVLNKILGLLTNPKPPDAELLKGYPNLWKTDIGEYRIIYRFDTDTLSVSLAGKRNDDEIYRQLKHKI